MHYCFNSPFNMTDQEGNEYQLFIEADDCPENPRNWDHTATILTWTRTYKVGDRHNFKTPFEALCQLCENYDIEYDEYEDDIPSLYKKLQEYKDIVIMPINAYEHSGITISTSNTYPYNDKWDGGQIGFAFIDKETVFKNFMSITEDNWQEKCVDCINKEVHTLDQWLQGDIYGYTLKKKVHQHNIIRCPHCNEIINEEEYDEWIEEDKCYGFYGDIIEENGMLEYLPDLEFTED